MIFPVGPECSSRSSFSTLVFQLCRESPGSGGGCGELLQGVEAGGRWPAATEGTKRPLRLPPLPRGEGFPAQSNRGENDAEGEPGLALTSIRAQ